MAFLCGDMAKAESADIQLTCALPSQLLAARFEAVAEVIICSSPILKD